MREPQTPEEWQEAVNAAAGARAVADCKLYGLLVGGPNINVRRCDQILARGRKQGITPSHPIDELAVAFVLAFNNEEADGNDTSVAS
jgi:hypothetical protein